jgi:hypothetical protein
MLGFILGFYYYIYFLKTIANLWEAATIQFFSINFFIFIIFVVTILIINRIKEKNKDLLYKKAGFFVILFSSLFLFIVTSNYVIISYAILNYQMIKQHFYAEMGMSAFFLIGGLILFVFNLYAFYLLKMSYSNTVNLIINNLFSSTFPTVEIVTKESYVAGKLDNIVDENFLILDSIDSISIIEWNQIQSIKMKKKLLKNVDLNSFQPPRDANP